MTPIFARVAVILLMTLAACWFTTRQTWAQSARIKLSIAAFDPETLALRLTGPVGERVVAEWSSNLLTWTVAETNAFIEPTISLYSPRRPGATFFRARRFEPVEACGALICNEETNGVTCPSYAPADNPTNRDASIPTGATPMKSIRLLVHVVADDYGANPAATIAHASRQLETVNQDFRPHRLQFVWDFRIAASNRFRQLFSRAHAEEMMRAFAVEPGARHNVFVTETPPGFLGFTSYPWATNDAGQPLALTPEGSTVISPRRFDQGEVTLTHELGHALGLWHTHHGSETELMCPPCWERADRLEADRTGDRRSDTPPAPLDGNCNLMTATDRCSRVAWPLAGAHNYMSAAPWCAGRFTPQQAGRMHCWITNRLSGWLDTNTPAAPSDFRVAANDFGEVELNWTDNSWNETGFRIERSFDGTNFVLLTNLPANATSFFDDTSWPNQPNFYRVFATNALAGVVSYATWPPRSAVPAPIAPITYVNFASTNAPPDGSELFPFLALSDALAATPKGSRHIFRVSQGDYPEPFVISNKAVRVESRGGSVIIGQPGGNPP